MQANVMKIALLMMVLIIVWRKTESSDSSGGSRIVGGSPVSNIRETPHVVNIQVNGQNSSTKQPFKGSYAAGTIFSPLYVITACHCVAKSDDDGNVVSMAAEYPLQYWRFVTGPKRLDKRDQTAQRRKPGSLSHHPKCQLKPYLMNDVGLAKMTEPFRMNAYVEPVGFFSFDRQKFEAQVNNIISSSSSSSRQPPRCKTAAWGKNSVISILDQFRISNTSVVPTLTNPDNTKEDDLRDQLKSLGVYLIHEEQCFVKVTEAIKAGLGSQAHLVDNATVEELYNKSLRNQICGLSRYGNESTCDGDSGSGLVCNGFLFGVTSWSVGCGLPDVPHVYQSLPNALDWMEKELCSVQSCQDAIHIHKRCKPPDPVYLDKCTQNVTREPVTGNPGVVTIPHAVTVNRDVVPEYPNVVTENPSGDHEITATQLLAIILTIAAFVLQ